MQLDVKKELDENSIFDELQLDSYETLIYTATRFRDYMQEFVPQGPPEGYTIKGQNYPSGELRKQTKVSVEDNTGLVEYEVPYATYQFYGERADKTHKVKKYTTPHTGKFWDELMMTAKGEQFKNEIEDYIGGNIK